ncbi:hypothetical protein CEXT_133061 [Caerostris extrusa]|uniref:Uncharacterized protein n=1 Tax=Caerostris extrusa TaxID=172846 RepID=A0AAV4XQD3_CAEEX|nr:hypothetical protein CEXT_133061 [Caerostris extrusa]
MSQKFKSLLASFSQHINPDHQKCGIYTYYQFQITSSLDIAVLFKYKSNLPKSGISSSKICQTMAVGICYEMMSSLSNVEPLLLIADVERFDFRRLLP